MAGEITHECRIRRANASDDHPCQLVRAVIAVMGLITALVAKSEWGSVWSERLVERLAHCVQIDQCDRILPGNSPHCVGITLETVSDLTAPVEVASLRRCDQYWNCASATRLGDISTQ